MSVWRWWLVASKEGVKEADVEGFVGFRAIVEMLECVGGELYKAGESVRYPYVLHFEREKTQTAVAKWLKDVAWFEPIASKPKDLGERVYAVWTHQRRRQAQEMSYYMKRCRGRHNYEFRTKRIYK